MAVLSTTLCPSKDISGEWNACVAYVMGFDVEDGYDSEAEGDNKYESSTKVINLLPHRKNKQPPSTTPGDPWTQKALQIHESIQTMSDLLKRKSAAFVDVFASLRLHGSDPNTMTEDDRSILQSTVASFAASTANQIDTLRQTTSAEHLVDDVAAHRAGVIACLLANLRSDVVDPMSILQKKASRKALVILRDPLRCQLSTFPSPTTAMRGDDWLLDEQGRNQPGDARRFTPQHSMPPRFEGEEIFGRIYAKKSFPSKEDLTPPPTKFQVKPRIEMTGEEKEDSTVPDERGSKDSRPVHKNVFVTNTKHREDSRRQDERNSAIESEDEILYMEELYQESALLTVSLQSDLDEVQKAEQQMVIITPLLSQFANLVSEQQEEILTIHDNTVKSKKNIEKGEDSVNDSKERGKKSRHLMASFIFAMAFLLLFFNWVTP